MSACPDACRQMLRLPRSHAVMDRRYSRTLRLSIVRSAPWCNHEASSMLTDPGSLILMTPAGRPMIISYWLGIQAEFAVEKSLCLAIGRHAQMASAWEPAPWLTRQSSQRSWLLTAARTLTLPVRGDKIGRQGLFLLYCALQSLSLADIVTHDCT